MSRKQTILLALAGAAALLFGTRMAILRAQQNPVVERAPSADNIPGNSRPVPSTPAGGFFTGPGAGWTTPVLASSVVADDDPELAELVQSEASLDRSAEEMVARYATTETAAERKDMAAALRNTLAKQFDAQRQRRELELRRIEDQVRKLRDQIKKRDEARDTIIDRRLDQLLNEAEGLGWAPATGPRNGAGLPADTTRSMMRGMMPGPRTTVPAAKR
jgi:hypothetical protein